MDHPDGLADPQGYLARLAEASRGCWIVVEKILERGEHLPADWACNGTTGYDALNRITGVFVDPAGEEPLTRLYDEVTGDRPPAGPPSRGRQARRCSHASSPPELEPAHRAGRAGRVGTAAVSATSPGAGSARGSPSCSPSSTSTAPTCAPASGRRAEARGRRAPRAAERARQGAAGARRRDRRQSPTSSLSRAGRARRALRPDLRRR